MITNVNPWRARGTKPDAPGIVEIKPFGTVPDMISEARWDGEKFRYLSTGQECYNQSPVWRSPAEALAA